MRATLPDRLATLARHAALVALLTAANLPPSWYGQIAATGCCVLRPAAHLAAIWAIHFVGFSVLWSLVLTGERVGARLQASLWKQWSVTALAAGGSVSIPLAFATEHVKASIDPAWRTDWNFMLIWSPVWFVLVAAFLVVAHGWSERSRRLDQAMHGSELERIAQERNLAEAHAQLLQAQIEPHFLFNALANVRRLLRTDGPAAEALLGDLLRYFEEALPRLRDARTTLGREAELVRAYLAVHQVRMGARLHAEVDVPTALADCTLPPMLLLTLVENALKHGVQPLVEGGMIRVAARAKGGELTLTVADTGRGMGSGLGAGTGLANTRGRLHSMYGQYAAFSLEVNPPRGVLATIRMPQIAA